MTVLYFAVPDPDDVGAMTYWRRTTGGPLMAWPPHARYGPALRQGDIPLDLDFNHRRAWLINWATDTFATWFAKIEAAVDADPHGCAARFARFIPECVICDAAVTDPLKVTALCPADRKELPGHVLGGFAIAVGRIHAEVTA